MTSVLALSWVRSAGLTESITGRWPARPVSVIVSTPLVGSKRTSNVRESPASNEPSPVKLCAGLKRWPM